jgi:hypothetical protein
MWTKPALAALLLALTACSGEEGGLASGLQPGRSSTSAASEVRPFEAGALSPGRYRYAVQHPCEETNRECLATPPKLPSVEVTVPTGWAAAPEYAALFPMPGRDSASPRDPALVMGWTNYDVRLYSRPCHGGEAPADIAVGPTVDDFVSAVTAHRQLHVSKPRPVTLGAHHGQFIRLTGPADIRKCGEWRPWDPSPYLQGPGNIWDLWVMDVAGTRVVIMAQYFPKTPATIKAELRHMAESVRLVPVKA